MCVSLWLRVWECSYPLYINGGGRGAVRYDNSNRHRASKSPDFSGDLPIFDKIMKISRSPDLE